MSDPGTAGRIPEIAYKASSTLLFGIALLAAAARTAIRLRYQKRLFVDDYFLFVAVVFLIASEVLLWMVFDTMYLAEALVTNQTPPPPLPFNFFGSLIQFLKMSDAFLVTSWTTVLAVKFSFLFFFRSLIQRVPRMQLYWWIVFGVTFAVWAFGCGAVFAPCPYFDFRSLNCSQGEQFDSAIAYSEAIIGLDIATDIMILAIPIYLISQIQVKLRQKIVLGASLCLSIVLIVISIVCGAGIRSPSTKAIDITWELYFQTVEACVAVLMNSLIAFRSFFVAQASRNQRSPFSPSSTSQRQRLLWRRKLRNQNSTGATDTTYYNTQGTSDTADTRVDSAAPPPAPRPRPRQNRSALPDIPSGRMSGIMTFIRRVRRSRDDIMQTQVLDEEADVGRAPGEKTPTTDGHEPGGVSGPSHSTSGVVEPLTASSAGFSGPSDILSRKKYEDDGGGGGGGGANDNEDLATEKFAEKGPLANDEESQLGSSPPPSPPVPLSSRINDIRELDTFTVPTNLLVAREADANSGAAATATTTAKVLPPLPSPTSPLSPTSPISATSATSEPIGPVHSQSDPELPIQIPSSPSSLGADSFTQRHGD